MGRDFKLLLPMALMLLGPGSGAGALPRIDRVPSSLVYPDFWHTPFGIHRGTQDLLDLMLGGRVQFNDPAGLACAHMVEFGENSPQLTVFGLNRGSGQILYNPDMSSLEVFGADGDGDGQFYQPKGIACLRDGTVAVADTGNNRVVILEF